VKFWTAYRLSILIEGINVLFDAGFFSSSSSNKPIEVDCLVLDYLISSLSLISSGSLESDFLILI
jgi:hypothetical protein